MGIQRPLKPILSNPSKVTALIHSWRSLVHSIHGSQGQAFRARTVAPDQDLVRQKPREPRPGLGRLLKLCKRSSGRANPVYADRHELARPRYKILSRSWVSSLPPSNIISPSCLHLPIHPLGADPFRKMVRHTLAFTYTALVAAASLSTALAAAAPPP